MNNLVSVIMSVYNTKAEYLELSINSILDQTYKNIEFIIIDDGCDLATKKILRSFKDNRINIIENKQNIGLTASLNVGLAYANGKYIARMDADDISLPQRIELQYQYMERNPNVAALGSWVNCNGEIHKHYGSIPWKIRKVYMLFGNAGIAHPSAFLRRDILLDNHIRYDENIKKAQDYKLWVDLIKVGKIEVYPQVLLYYRMSEECISKKYSAEQINYTNIIRKNVVRELYDKVLDEELEQFLDFSKKLLEPKAVQELLNKIIEYNIKKGLYDQKILIYEMTRMWGIYVANCLSKKCFDKDLCCTWLLRIFTPAYIFHRLYMIILKNK